MKTKKLIFVLFLTYVLGCTGMQAQVVEKEIEGKTYVFDYTKGIVENKDISSMAKYDFCEEYNISDNTNLMPELGKIFSKERAKELLDENMRITFMFIWDSSGSIVHVAFLFRDGKNIDKVTLTEIKGMEETLKQWKIKFTTSCKGQKYYYIYIRCNFKVIYDKGYN